MSFLAEKEKISTIDLPYHQPFRWKKDMYFWLGLCAALLIYIWMVGRLQLSLTAHSFYDSYTLQAMAWREGRLDLAQDIYGLELAYYAGKIYVCFPPVPAIPMWLLSFIFGANTPSRLVMLGYFIGIYITAYALARRLGNSDKSAGVWALFLVCGSNLLDISLFGWVWYMAQSAAFLLTLLALWAALSENKATRALSLAFIALAVGCRPMNIVYAPALLWMVWTKTSPQSNIKQRIKEFLPLLIAPILIGIGYGIYNYVRFENPFEFGYNYLPEFQKDAQFGLAYLPTHVKKLFFDFPHVESGRLMIPDFDGFAFYIANPIFLLLPIRLLRGPRKMDGRDWLLLAGIVLNFILLMLHRTFGGWQFGTRYLLDLLPAVYFLCVKDRKRMTRYETPILLFGILFNVVGSLIFRTAYPDFLLG